MISRRGFVLAGAGAVVALPPGFARAQDRDMPLLRFDELYGAAGPRGLSFSAKVQELRGRPVRMRGYAAPPLRADARFLVLTRQPMSICPFCSSDADWPADIMVVYCRQPSLVPGGQLLQVTGRLEAGSATDSETGFVSQLRLREAEIVRP